MNKELMEALDILEKEKEISKETLFEAIENSLLTACKNHFGKADNVKVEIDRKTCDFLVYAERKWWRQRMTWRMTACRSPWRMPRRFPREPRWEMLFMWKSSPRNSGVLPHRMPRT